MARKQQKRKKRIPQRTCVGCREVRSKRDLLRLVRTAEGIKYDPSGKANGRGAYIHDQRECWENALKGSLEKALRITISDENRDSLRAVMDTLTANNND